MALPPQTGTMLQKALGMFQPRMKGHRMAPSVPGSRTGCDGTHQDRQAMELCILALSRQIPSTALVAALQLAQCVTNG